MSVTPEDVIDALRSVRYPGFSRDIVAFGLVKDLQVEGGDVRLQLDLGAGNPAVAPTLERDARAAIERIAGVRTVHLRIAAAGLPGPRAAVREQAAGALDDALIPDVRDVVAVASGKGGVGKSTVAV